MKILLIHTYYQIKGGEEAVFEQEYALLKKHQEVRRLVFYNKSGLCGAMQFFFSIWNIRAATKVRKTIRKNRPDVVHIHNWHFASGPLIIRTVKKMGIPVVLTLHNYRLLCPSATLFYKDHIFTDSLYTPFPWKAIRNKLYRNSAFQTFWLAFIIWAHKKMGTWQNVDQYIVLTDFAKTLFLNSTLGLKERQFTVKPNFVHSSPINFTERKRHFLFVGRLTEEKGIGVLISAFARSGYQLQIAGSGPLMEEVGQACEEFESITYLGSLNRAEVIAAMQKCSAIIFPSIWYEGMPMTIIEASSLGTPVIASNLGVMASLVKNGDNGLLFEPGDVHSLQNVLDIWSSFDESVQKQYCRNARAFYEMHYTPEYNYTILERIYMDSFGKQPC